jgi:hypothetical protein
MVLVLSRGGFCPKDRRQAELLVQLHRELEVGYCRLVTISTDNIALTSEYRSGVGAHWPFLSDAGRIVQKDLDIAEYTDPDHDPMIPHVIVLEPGFIVYKIYNGYWYFVRPTLEDLVPSPKSVGRIGISQMHGWKAAKIFFTHMAKPLRKRSASKTRAVNGPIETRAHVTLRRDGQ